MSKTVSLLFVSLLCAAALFLPASRAQEEKEKRSPLAQARTVASKDLDKVLRSYERLSLDTARAARGVRQTGRLTLNTGRRTIALELEPHDLRAANYRAEETVAPGVTLPVASGPVRTFRGQARAGAGARQQGEARFTIDEESFEGMILTPEERYYVEPASRYQPSAAPTDFLFYKASDVIEAEPYTCGLSLHDKVSKAADELSEEKSFSIAAAASDGPSPALLVIPLEAEVATEADFEYVTALGGTAGANNEILGIMNQVEGVYQTEIGLSFKITYQHAWATSADPYTTVDPVLAIKEFTNYWNANFQAVTRDLAHMWTGKNLTNTTGVGWTGVVCSSPGSSYGLSERLTTIPRKYSLTAHEIGHNFNASHTDGTAGCADTIMQSVTTPTSALTFCQTSRNQITSYINANSSCLSVALACAYTIAPTSGTFPAAGGSGQITVTTNAVCSWTAASNVTWISVTAGASGSGNGTVSYTVAANTATTSRSGTMTVAGKTFTVTQGGAAPAISVTSLTLSPVTVVGCKGATGTVKISAPAPANGVVVTLSDTLPAATVPASVTIPAGGTTKTFTITTVPVSANQTGTVTAKLGTSTRSATLTVRRIGVLAVRVSPNPVVGGNAATGTVTLECAAGPGNITVTLADNLSSTTLPASIIVPAGATSKTFQITTSPVAARQTGTVTATAGGVSKSAALTVRPIGVFSLTLSPGTVTAGSTSTGTVTLERPAGPGNIVVTLSSSNPSAAAPTTSSITIAAGARSKTFTVKANNVAVTTRVTITATANGVGKSATLTVNPAPEGE